jgi:exopolysaccharide biosynthesis protein
MSQIALQGTLAFKGARGYSAYEIAVNNGYTGTEQDWLAQLGTSSHFNECSHIHTATANQTEFALPDCYTSNTFIDVYVDGARKRSDEYTVTDKITLTTGLTEGAKVEIIALTMSTNDLPIINNPASATNDSVLSSKTIVDDLYNNYVIDEITVNKFHHETSNTDYYIAHIPHEDSDGNIIKLKRGFADDVESNQLKATETARSFANRKNATLCINAGIFDITALTPIGLIVHNGEVMSNQGTTTSANEIMGIKEDNTIIPYDYNTESSVIISAGCNETVTAFEHLLINGVRQSTVIAEDYRYQWNILGQNTTTKDFYLFVCDGKNIDENQGMTLSEALTILEDYDCDYAFRLDQGGSTSLIYKGEMINRKTDESGHSERKVTDFIYFVKETKTQTDDDLSNIYKKIGELKEEIRNLELDLFSKDTINKPRMYLEAGELTETNNQGASIVVRRNGTNSAGIILDNYTYPKSLSLWDYENSKTLFRAKADGYLQTVLGEIGFFPKHIQQVTNINNLNTTTIVYCQSTVSNSPYTDKPAIIFNFTIGEGTTNMVQLAIPLSAVLSGNTTIKVRNKTLVNSIWTWGQWYSLSIGG